MSKNEGSVLSKKNDSMFTVVALLLGIVAGIVVYQLTDPGTVLVILYVLILVFGIYYLVTVPFAGDERDFIPSGRSFRLVWGALLTAVGALMLFHAYDLIKELWILLVIMLLVVVAVVLFLVMSRRGG